MSAKTNTGYAAPISCVVKVVKPTLTIERPSNPATGCREIWARHADYPEFDVKLVTVHYSHGYLDNSSNAATAEAILKLLAGRDSDSDPQGGDAVAAPGEASQSGGAAASPTPSSRNPETPNDR